MHETLEARPPLQLCKHKTRDTWYVKAVGLLVRAVYKKMPGLISLRSGLATAADAMASDPNKNALVYWGCVNGGCVCVCCVVNGKFNSL